MKVFYSDPFTFPLPEDHRFPRRKYRLLRLAVEEAALVPAEALLLAPAATDEEILRVHSQDYLERLKAGRLTAKEQRRVGLPWSPELVERARRSTGGTLAACRAALEDGLAVNLAGGTHHAFRDHGQGFCLLNDSVIAIRALQAEGRIQRAVVLDCDVHQGNGTAALAAGDDSIYTFSIHSESNFPLFKVQSDLDIGLDDGAGDDVYLAALATGIRQALVQARADLALFLAGADPFEGDRLGKLALTMKGLAQRDRLVLARCQEAGLPVAVLMAGGYGRRVEDTVAIHFQTVRIAAEMSAAARGNRALQQVV
jgi:acetoin utilization deacetylase AcuC-like enzyme